MLTREASFTRSELSFHSVESNENRNKSVLNGVVLGDTASKGHSATSLVSNGSLQIAPDSPKTICEVFPRIYLYCPGDSLLQGVSVDVRSWLGEVSDNGGRVVLFRTGCSARSSELNAPIFKNQVLEFPNRSSSRHNMAQVLEVVSALVFWHQLDRRENIVMFDVSCLNVLGLAACLLAANFSLTVDAACSQIDACMRKPAWTAADVRYIEYMHTILRGEMTGVSHRPRPVLVKQLLIDSCFCAEKDLEILIKDENKECLNQHVVQFFHEETQSIAVQFPQMKNFLFQGDVCVSVRSRRQSNGNWLEFRFNTGFMDNLTSSVQTCAYSKWDQKDTDMKMVFSEKFSVQIITVPATNTTSSPIVVSPYALSPSASLFAERHIGEVRQEQLKELVSKKSEFDVFSVSVALKVTSNNYLDAVTFLYKNFVDVPETRRAFSKLNLPAGGDQDDARSVISRRTSFESLGGSSRRGGLKKNSPSVSSFGGGFKSLGSPSPSVCSVMFNISTPPDSSSNFSKPDELLTPSPPSLQLPKSPPPNAIHVAMGKAVAPPLLSKVEKNDVKVIPKSAASPPPLPSAGAKVPSLPLRKAPPIPSGSGSMLFPEPSSGAETDQLPLGRKLHWRPLRNVESTIWATMDLEKETADFSALKSVFDDRAKQQFSSANLERSSSGLGGRIALLESKRAQNIGVVVARIPMDLVTQRMAALETESLSIEVLDRLKMVLPTEEESKVFWQFKEDISHLRDIEQKVFNFFKIPRLIQRIKFCSLAIQLPGLMVELRAEIDVLRKCAIEIRNSEKLKKLLHLVLLLGNYVNHGESLGKKTRGFSIEGLSKLSEFKSSADPSITTMHYLCAKLLAEDASLIDVNADIPSLKTASKISPESIAQSVLAVKNDPEIVKNELKIHRDKYVDAAVGRMESFLRETEPKAKQLAAEWTACEIELAEIRKFFGEDPKKTSVEDFLSHLRKFADGIASTVNEMRKRPKRFDSLLISGSSSPLMTVVTTEKIENPKPLLSKLSRFI